MGAGSSSVKSELKYVLSESAENMSHEGFAAMEELVIQQAINARSAEGVSPEDFAVMEELVMGGLDEQDRLHLIEALRDNELVGVDPSWSFGDVCYP
jgi:hypothetical protein